MKKITSLVLVIIIGLCLFNVVYAESTYELNSVIEQAKPIQYTINLDKAKRLLNTEKNWVFAYRTLNQGGKHLAVPVYMSGYRSFDCGKLNRFTDINSGKNMMQVYINESTVDYMPMTGNNISASDICGIINSNFNIGADTANTRYNYRYKGKYFIEAQTELGDLSYRVYMDLNGKILGMKSSGNIKSTGDFVSPNRCIEIANQIVSKNNTYSISEPNLTADKDGITVKYYQIYNGMTYYDNYIEVKIDAYGNITGFWNISDDITFVDTNGVVEKSRIVSKIVNNLEIVDTYYYMNNVDYTNVSDVLDKNLVSVKYTYKYNYYINAKTGKLIDENGNQVN